MVPAPQINMDLIRENRHRLYLRALEVYGTEHEASLWFSEPHPALDNRPPVAFSENEEQMKRVLELLEQIEFGVYI